MPGGRLVFDVFAPGAEDIADTHGRWLEREPGIFERADWDSRARTLTLSVRGDSGATTFTLAWLSPDEWRGAARACGVPGARLLRLVRPPALRGRRGHGLDRPPPAAESHGREKKSHSRHTSRNPTGIVPGSCRFGTATLKKSLRDLVTEDGRPERTLRAARPGRRGRSRPTRRRAPASRACPEAPRAGPSRSSSIRWHGSQTIVISKTASPARTRWPIGHFSTSSPSTVRFSRISPGSTPTDSRCSLETNNTSRFGGFAWAQPSSPSPAMARMPLVRRRSGRSCAPARSRSRRSWPFAASLSPPPAAPAVVRRKPALLGRSSTRADRSSARRARTAAADSPASVISPSSGSSIVVHHSTATTLPSTTRLAHPHLHALLRSRAARVQYARMPSCPRLALAGTATSGRRRPR